MKASKYKDIKNKMPKLEWLLHPFIPKNHITILASPGGTGKSSIALYFANELTGQGKRVLYIDAEQCGDEINDRCERWKLPFTDDIYFSHTDEEDNSIQTLAPTNNEELENLIKTIQPDLVIIDSLTAYCDIDLTQRQKASKAFIAIKKIASKYHTGVLILCHTNKENPSYITGVDSISGSKGLSDLARSVLMLSKVNDEGKRKIAQEKANAVQLTADKNIPFLFTITEEGIVDADFDKEYCEAREMFAFEYDSGVKAEKFRRKTLELLKLKKEKSEIISTLKELGASGTECTRAYKAALDHISK